MDDAEILRRIHDLVEEEHRLHDSAGEDGLDENAHRQLARLEAQLDQQWDWLRRRRAARRAGDDPDQVQPRDIDTVEHYEQ